MFNVSALLLDYALSGTINENQLIFDEVKVYKNYTKFLGHPAGCVCDSYFRQ